VALTGGEEGATRADKRHETSFMQARTQGTMRSVRTVADSRRGQTTPQRTPMACAHTAVGCAVWLEWVGFLGDRVVATSRCPYALCPKEGGRDVRGGDQTTGAAAADTCGEWRAGVAGSTSEGASAGVTCGGSGRAPDSGLARCACCQVALATGEQKAP
jgi:hypothetical protein